MSLDFYLSCPVDSGKPEHDTECFWRNITHNMIPMWRKAGVVDALYDSEGQTAGDLVPALSAGLAHLAANRHEYEPLKPDNGWGDYDAALSFLSAVTSACSEYPKAKVHISR